MWMEGSPLDTIVRRHGLLMPAPENGSTRAATTIYRPSVSIPGMTASDQLASLRRGIRLQARVAWRSGGVLRPRNWRQIISKLGRLLPGR